MKKLFLGLAFIASTSVFASGVKGGKFGIDFSYVSNLTTPSPIVSSGAPSIGVWWHVIDMIALRPSVGFSSTSAGGATTTNLEFGIGVPIYLAKFNALDLYVSPAFSYLSRSSSVGGVSVTSSGWGVSGSLGLQVGVHDQVHLFGEVGFGYAADLAASGTGSTTFSTTRTAVGAIFYFN